MSMRRAYSEEWTSDEHGSENNQIFAIGLAVLIIVSIISGAIALTSMVAGGFGGRDDYTLTALQGHR